MRKSPLPICVVLAASTLVVTAQGPLEPPGIPQPTMRTLEQVEPRVPISKLPFTISVPGSYYLTRNLTGAAGEVGLQINSDNVTVDLNGFLLLGNGGAPAIFMSGRRNVAIRNGSITGWEHGISGFDSVSCEFTKLRLANNSAEGLRLST